MIYKIEMRVWDTFDDKEKVVMGFKEGDTFAEVYEAITKTFGEDAIMEITARVLSPDKMIWEFIDKSAVVKVYDELEAHIVSNAVW